MRVAGHRLSQWLRPGLAGAILLAAVAAAGTPPDAGAGAGGGSPPHPNVVVIMADDQTQEEVRVESNVLNEIGARGVTFDNNFVNFSLCCPSRSTFLTGLYAHNHHVMDNSPPFGGFQRFEDLDSSNDLPLWLQQAGYYTGQVGKYLNEYGKQDPTLIPPGWNDLNAVSGPVDYYDYNINSNGTLVHYGEAPKDYVDDVITGKAVSFIDSAGATGAPFFLYVAYKAPHIGGPPVSGNRCASGPEPPPRHLGAFADEALPPDPSFNEADVSDKPAQIQALPLLTDADIASITTDYQCELEALLGVDDGVGRIMDALRRQGALKNTYVIYSSDNGFFHGQHRVPTGKARLYEPSIRVPLLMRGPGIPAGKHIGDLSINADLAPTIVDATGATANRVMDGKSLLPAAATPGVRTGRRLLIETRKYKAVRTARYIYAEHDSGERELYDLANDPAELQNVADAPAYADAQAALADDLSKLKFCAGFTCRRKPQLELRLHYTRRYSRRGHPNSPLCAEKPVMSRVTGADEGLLRLVSFRIHHTTVQASAAPFRVTLPAAAMSDRHPNDVRATVDLADGARLTLDGEFEQACG
jgi:N-acetylglucosamine-6-sulfatase